MKKIVYDTNGVEWVIKRHWVPRKLNFKFLKKFTRYKNSNKDSLKNFAEIGFVDDIVGIVVSLLIVILLYCYIVILLYCYIVIFYPCALVAYILGLNNYYIAHNNWYCF